MSLDPVIICMHKTVIMLRPFWIILTRKATWWKGRLRFNFELRFTVLLHSCSFPCWSLSASIQIQKKVDHENTNSQTERYNALWKSCSICLFDRIVVAYNFGVVFTQNMLTPLKKSFGAFDKLPWVDPAGLTRVSPWQELIERSHSPSRGDGMHPRSFARPQRPVYHPWTAGMGLSRARIIVQEVRHVCNPYKYGAVWVWCMMGLRIIKPTYVHDTFAQPSAFG